MKRERTISQPHLILLLTTLSFLLISNKIYINSFRLPHIRHCRSSSCRRRQRRGGGGSTIWCDESCRMNGKIKLNDIFLNVPRGGIADFVGEDDDDDDDDNKRGFGPEGGSSGIGQQQQQQQTEQYWGRQQQQQQPPPRQQQSPPQGIFSNSRTRQQEEEPGSKNGYGMEDDRKGDPSSQFPPPGSVAGGGGGGNGGSPPPPQLPGYPGDDTVMPPELPSQNHQEYVPPRQQQQQQPQQPQQVDPNSIPSISNNNEDNNNNSGGGGGGGLDLSQFDKDMIFAGLKRMYKKKILPLELSSKFGHFHSAPLSPSDFDAKPMVLLLGQYSVGKTSFIRYLLGRDFPGARIGPEPTTDRFTSIMAPPSSSSSSSSSSTTRRESKIIPGAALCSQADRPFRGLSPFGNNFLSRFEGVEITDSPILQNITLVDTPGILSGQKQNLGRHYDYESVMKWFAERADLIIIMFDAHKLDISDELKRVIELMKPHSDKIRVVLNKADSVSTQQLMRVYGALMWSLGKVMNTPEVCRVYMGSFWGAPLQNNEQAELLTREKLDLFGDIAKLPQNAVMRRINELVKRARSVKVHAYIIHYLRKQLPYTFGKREKQRKLIDRLDREFLMCARRYELPLGDFPPLEPFRQALREIKDLSEFPKLDKKMVREMDKVFSNDIPELLERAKRH